METTITMEMSTQQVYWEMKNMNKVYQCFPGGKHKALTKSYDDGSTQDRRLIEIFNKYGIRGTFHLNSGLMDAEHVQPEEIPELYKGHEVSCHTVTHPTIARCPLPMWWRKSWRTAARWNSTPVIPSAA